LGFSGFVVILTTKPEKPHHLRQRQAQSAEALPMPHTGPNVYERPFPNNLQSG
jgi:hypothetical protein